MGPLCTRGCPLNDSIVSGICRCSLGMAWYFSSQLQFCDGLGQFIAGPGPLCPHMVASRCRIPSCGCHSLSQSAGVCFILERFLVILLKLLASISELSGHYDLTFACRTHDVHFLFLWMSQNLRFFWALWELNVPCHEYKLLTKTKVWCWQALLSAISKRIKGFMRLRTAMTTLQGALPDATQVELLEYEDDCAICKVCLCQCFLELFHVNVRSCSWFSRSTSNHHWTRCLVLQHRFS